MTKTCWYLRQPRSILRLSLPFVAVGFVLYVHQVLISHVEVGMHSNLFFVDRSAVVWCRLPLAQGTSYYVFSLGAEARSVITKGLYHRRRRDEEQLDHRR